MRLHLERETGVLRPSEFENPFSAHSPQPHPFCPNDSFGVNWKFYPLKIKSQSNTTLEQAYFL
jgi:hypothetical protein